ncbi:MAG: ribosome small subunit-dependent GTPase A [Verrucomicrobia bacterium]|nr:ribosome small subunit-dependent GTPase A [Verrucomicrobiota bacterium]
MDLTSFGWNTAFEQAFAVHQSTGLKPARIVAEAKHQFTALTKSGPLEATLSGRFLHQAESRAALPKVGDWVAIEPLAGEDKAIIHHVLPRRTRLSRKAAGRDLDEHVLAANVDVAFVVQALDASFDLRKLERVLIMAYEGGVAPVVVLNKTDLCGDLEARLAEARVVAGAAPVLAVCARTGHAVRKLLDHAKPGSTTVFVGPSGVGKSSLINRLCGDDAQPTIEVRARDAKGRHTTTWREIIPLPNGAFVIDTPGLREFHLWLAGEGMPSAFADIEDLALQCHFRGCSHTNEKRCAVQAAVETGQLPAARLANYLKLQRELKHVATESRELAYLARKRNARAASRPSRRFTEDSDAG